ncbi:MAG: hypothetical protein KDA68_17915, partial [Planctomycetaceae bacterium]|nr:hypothetical protein [Planctomycetaceae bacterium]
MGRSAYFFLIFISFCCQIARSEDEVRPLSDLQKQVEKQQNEIEELRRQLNRQSGLIENVSESQIHRMPSEGESEAPKGFLDNPPIDEDPIEFLEALSRVARRTVNGRVHIDHWSVPKSSSGINIIENGTPTEDPDNELLYRRIRIGVRGKVPPENMSYRLEIEFSGQDGSQFRDAWIGWDDLVFFQTIRLGNQKRPYGWGHLNSSNFMVFLERPFVVDAFNEDSRRFGLTSYGVSEDMAFNWQYGAYYLPIVQDVGSIQADRLQTEFAYRLSNTWWYDESSEGRGYGHWGLAGTFAFPDGDAPNNGTSDNEAQFRTRPEGRTDQRWLDTGQITGAESYQILGIESVLNYGQLQIAGEFQNLWLQRRTSTGDNIYLHGGYIYFSYFLTGEHIPWNRELGVIGRVEPFEN